MSKATRRKGKRQRNRKIVRDAKNRPCQDCGEIKHLHSMTFDHRDASKKKFNLSDISRNLSLSQVLNEISKCDVVCRDCHDEREIRRGVMNAPLEIILAKELSNQLDYDLSIGRMTIGIPTYR